MIASTSYVSSLSRGHALLGLVLTILWINFSAFTAVILPLIQSDQPHDNKSVKGISELAVDAMK